MALKLKGSTSGFVAIDAPSVAGNNTLILPENTGSAGQILANDITAGVTTFTQVTVSRNGDLTVPGTISIGGTLTYEDVTSVDSVGIVTARGLSIFGNTSGLQVASGISTFVDVSERNITVTGVGTFSGGLIHVTSATSPAIRLQDTNNANSDFKIYSPDGDNHLRIYHQNTTSDLVTVTSGGTVGIATISPAGKLDVHGSGSTALIRARRLDGNGGYNLFEGYSDVNAASTFYVSQNGLGFFNQRVNIGTSDAGYGDADDLNIATSAHTGMTIRSGTSSLGTIAFSDGTSGQAEYKGFVQYNHSQDTLHLGSAHQSKATINADGNTKFAGIVTATSYESTTFSKTPTNTPAFHAWSSPVTSPSLPDATLTKVTFLVTETFDTDSAYDNSSSGTTANRFTVPAGKTGFYQISAGLNFYANNNDIRHARAVIKQNGNVKMTAYGFISSYAAGTRHFQCNLSGILELANDGDYLELFGYLDTDGGSQGYFSNDANGYRGNFFSAFKLII